MRSSNNTIVVECVDQDYYTGATDYTGAGCQFYNDFPERCGFFDDDDFEANSMCCACKIGNFRHDQTHK